MNFRIEIAGHHRHGVRRRSPSDDPRSVGTARRSDARRSDPAAGPRRCTRTQRLRADENKRFATSSVWRVRRSSRHRFPVRGRPQVTASAIRPRVYGKLKKARMPGLRRQRSPPRSPAGHRHSSKMPMLRADPSTARKRHAQHRAGEQIALAVVDEAEASFRRDFVVARKRSRPGDLRAVGELITIRESDVDIVTAGRRGRMGFRQPHGCRDSSCLVNAWFPHGDYRGKLLLSPLRSIFCLSLSGGIISR